MVTNGNLRRSVKRMDTGAQPADVSERVTRSSTRTRNPNPAGEGRTTPPNLELNRGDLCGKCEDPVSHDLPSVRCAFCGDVVHAHCDMTLTSKAVKIINDDRYPSVCYQCSKCRAAIVVSCTNSEGDNKMENRMSKLEEQLKQITSLVQNLTSQDVHVQSAEPPNETLEQPTCTYAGVTATALNSKTQKNFNPVANSPTTRKSKEGYSKMDLSVICTNVPEATDTLLSNRHDHDMNEWLKLCSRMSLNDIKPVTLTRLSRKPNSPHQNSPRLLKVVVRSEKELENILLSTYLLRGDKDDSSRVFADVPWSERSKASIQTKQDHRTKKEERSLVILNVPESAPDLDAQGGARHDLQQWKYLSDIIEAKNEAVIDLFRIPKSPKYKGDGPRPLKITLLTAKMAETVFHNWTYFRHKLPRELRIKRSNSKPQPDTTNRSNQEQSDPEHIIIATKNGGLPAPIESAN